MPTINSNPPPAPDNATANITDPGSTLRTAAPDKLWAALRDHPGATGVELAVAAGIGRSTAAKILARWATDNRVTRTATPPTTGRTTGQPGRNPERWSITDTDTTAARPAPEMQTDSETADKRRDTTTAADHLAAAAGGSSAQVSPDDVTASTASTHTGTDDDRAGDGSTLSGPQEDGSDPITGSQPDAADASDSPPSGRTHPGAAAACRAQRLPAGGLRGLVEDYLRDHPDAAFGPSHIGKDLSRSGGAVANALVKLVDAGSVVVVQDKPRRYQLAPGESTSDRAPAADAPA